ncbi:MAG: isocitrate lyase/phosphoenolpyruvate mutase family protein [Pseudomonadota bacterium]|nr:isocitrate lyase/phosphoenolpyruvate mutase family protein [Pseudomonadota bacterium]
MYWTPRREKFRSLLEADVCYHPGSVFDPISARIAEDIGFEIGMFAGSVASLEVLGAPDLIVLTLSELADQAYRINRAGNLPLLVDADHGYGNALNVRRTVEELETAGVAGLTIEDTNLPQPFGTVGSTRILGIEEGIGKMKAALSGRQDPSLVVAGRTSAASINGLDDAIERGQAYQSVGIDAMFFTGVTDKDQIQTIDAALDIPVFLGGDGTGVLGDREFLSRHGVRISLQGHHPFMASVRATYETLTALRAGKSIEKNTPEFMQSVTHADHYKRWMAEFLGS